MADPLFSDWRGGLRRLNNPATSGGCSTSAYLPTCSGRTEGGGGMEVILEIEMREIINTYTFKLSSSHVLRKERCEDIVRSMYV